MKKLILLLLICITSIIYAQQNNDAVRIAVLDFGTSGGLSDMEAVTLTNRLRSMLVKTNAFIVLERGKMDEILTEQGFQQTGCTTTECAVEVGKMLNVQKMVSGTIGKLGRTWTMDISLIDIGTSQIEKSFFQDYKGEIDELLTIMESVAIQIANITGASRQVTIEVGKLKVIVEPEQAEIFLDNKSMGNSPLELENVVPGKHILQVKAEGFATDEREIEIIKNRPAILDIKLKKIFTLSIKSAPAQAQVFINNLQVGVTPVMRRVNEGEKIQVTLRKENYNDWTRELTITKNEEIQPILKYTDAYKKSLIKTYTISIKSTPPGAQIFLNNKNAGKTPFTSKAREGVKIKIKLQKENYKDWVRNITISDNINIKADLEFTQAYKDKLADRAKKQKTPTAVTKEAGSSSTWWWIGGGVLVAGGVAAAVLLSGNGNGDEEPTPVFPLPPGRP